MCTLEQVVPWGRSFDEYRRIFALTDDDLRLRILGCGDGGEPQRRGDTSRRSGRLVRSDLPERCRSDPGADRVDLRSNPRADPPERRRIRLDGDPIGGNEMMRICRAGPGR
jgi:hypothetical protein